MEIGRDKAVSKNSSSGGGHLRFINGKHGDRTQPALLFVICIFMCDDQHHQGCYYRLNYVFLGFQPKTFKNSEVGFVVIMGL